MNKFCITELPNNIVELDIHGNKADLAQLIHHAMVHGKDIREIILAGVIVWAQQTGNDLCKIAEAGK